MLEVKGLEVRFGGVAAVDGVDLVVPDGELVCVLGPSGCGKTTLLRAIAGLETPTAGRVAWDGDDLSHVPPHRRGVGLMFQDFALFPHRDVKGNVAFGLRMRHLPPSEARHRVTEVLGLVGLAGFEDRSVATLSGGEQQRVALARALAPRPRLLLLDEPLGALDRTLRERLVVELRELLTSLGLTAVYVTHDQEEAFALADRLVVMRAGRVVQSGPPGAVWAHPVDDFVARFLGFENVLDAVVRDGRVVLPWRSTPAPDAVEGRVRVVIRPDAVRLSRDGDVRGVVASRTYRGDHFVVRVATDAGPVLAVSARETPPPAIGDRVALTLDPSGVVILA